MARGDCRRCGARRIDNQIGLEPTPDAFVQALVGVFAEVRRVLADDGVVWLNLGDSYNSGIEPGRNDTHRSIARADGTAAKPSQKAGLLDRDVKRTAPCKPKDLVGIPWSVAFALRADGWYLRSDIIWSKPNPMPESVTDRPTKAHEYIFLLSKQERYYYDAEAIQEPILESSRDRFASAHDGEANRTKHQVLGGTYARPVKDILMGQRDLSGRNKRSVWHVATQPYPDAHFATYPEKLIEPCILAGTSEKGCCPACSAPWERVVERESSEPTSAPTSHRSVRLTADGTNGLAADHVARGHARPPRNASSASLTLGWEPSCACNAGDPIPCTVLDPFCGSGTTGAVAIKHGRHFIGIELNGDYVQLARRRIGDTAPLFAEEKTA